MKDEEDYLSINKKAWNARTAIHVDSAFYDMPGFLAGRNMLNSIELELLGDVKGKKILHLQCHFGQDSICLARMGASVTGVDLSDAAIRYARELVLRTETDATFICCDLYSLEENLEEEFDFVFSSYGTIGWLPDIDRWAKIVARYLKPGGKFVFAEFHPVVWMFDDDFTKIAYSYFKDAPIVEEQSGTYADETAAITEKYVTWNHGLGEVLTALLRAGLRIDEFKEFCYSPYNCFRNAVEVSKGEFCIAGMEKKLPMVYALKATGKTE